MGATFGLTAVLRPSETYMVAFRVEQGAALVSLKNAKSGEVISPEAKAYLMPVQESGTSILMPLLMIIPLIMLK